MSPPEACVTVSPSDVAEIGAGCARAERMFSESAVDCVENENVSTTLAVLTPTAPAICRCAPVSRQMPLIVPVSDVQVGSAVLMR